VPRYRLLWLELAEQQYLGLPAELRDPVDHQLDQLLQAPTAQAEAAYNETSDQWSVPVDDHGFLFFAVVPADLTVIVLRIVVTLG
jgi:hypothetical protein